jgi:hypothetical protein
MGFLICSQLWFSFQDLLTFKAGVRKFLEVLEMRPNQCLGNKPNTLPIRSNLGAYLLLRYESGLGPDYAPTRPKFKRQETDFKHLENPEEEDDVARRARLEMVLKACGFKPRHIPNVFSDGDAWNFRRQFGTHHSNAFFVQLKNDVKWTWTPSVPTSSKAGSKNKQHTVEVSRRQVRNPNTKQPKMNRKRKLESTRILEATI